MCQIVQNNPKTLICPVLKKIEVSKFHQGKLIFVSLPSTEIISLPLRSKFHEFDMQPLCKKCYEKMPLELKKRLKKAEQTASRKWQYHWHGNRKTSTNIWSALCLEDWLYCTFCKPVLGIIKLILNRHSLNYALLFFRECYN